MEPITPTITQTSVGAQKAITTETDGEITFKTPTEVFVANDPAGTDQFTATGSGGCYSLDQLRQIEDQVRIATAIGEEALAMIYVQDGTLCANGYDQKRGVGWAADKRFIAIKDPDRNNVVHEIGHALGLSHFTTLDCVVKDPNEIYMPVMDIAAFSPGAKCDVDRNEDGRINEYGNAASVMGRIAEENMYNVRLFTTSDKNKLMPQKYKIKEIEPVEGEYKISLRPGALSGISLALPADHPLKRIDPTMNKIQFTADYTNRAINSNIAVPCSENDGCDVSMTAVGDRVRYDVPFNRFFYEKTLMLTTDIRHIDNKQYSSVIYADKALNVIVTKQIETEADYATLHILPYEKGKPLMDKQNSLYAEFQRAQRLKQ